MSNLGLYRSAPPGPVPGQPTSRDKLDILLGYLRRALRYWWLVAAVLVVGGVLSVLFAVTRKPVYQSSAVLFYHERIMASLLGGRDAAQTSRNIGERYREILLARTQLQKIVEEFSLTPEIVATEGIEGAIEVLRLNVQFQLRGGNTFKIVYQDKDPQQAKLVTARLTQILIEEDNRIRREQASTTKNFLEKQKTDADTELKRRERFKAEFLFKHPEFAEDQQATNTPGAAVRNAQRESNRSANAESAGRDKLSALERQRDRVRASLANPDAPPPPPPPRRERTAVQIAADQKVEEAQREFDAAKRALEEMKGEYTDRHPAVISAKDRVQSAGQRLRTAQAAAAGITVDEGGTAVATPRVSREELQRQLSDLQQQINAEQARMTKARAGQQPTPTATEGEDSAPNWVVQLETEWSRLSRDVDEQRDQVDGLQTRLSDAALLADSQMAEQGSSLVEVDPAFKPTKPTGKGKTILVLAGVFLFGALGMTLALGLAIIDDRIYRRHDLDVLELAPVLAVIPKHQKRRKGKR